MWVHENQQKLSGIENNKKEKLSRNVVSKNKKIILTSPKILMKCTHTESK